jgi:hypothetical protein
LSESNSKNKHPPPNTPSAIDLNNGEGIWAGAITKPRNNPIIIHLKF